MMNLNDVTSASISHHMNVTTGFVEASHTAKKAEQETTVLPKDTITFTKDIGQLLHMQEYELSDIEKQRVEKVEKALKSILGPEKRWEFSVHKDLKEIMVKVIDRETKKVLREVPPEKLLDMVAGMLKTTGLLIDKKW
ncbi:flagellar protein FlaG [Aneurinibacillus danicus]|nr:flagellar protein FlaG [Aneurinibacillus danicus]